MREKERGRWRSKEQRGGGGGAEEGDKREKRERREKSKKLGIQEGEMREIERR